MVGLCWGLDGPVIRLVHQNDAFLDNSSLWRSCSQLPACSLSGLGQGTSELQSGLCHPSLPICHLMETFSVSADTVAVTELESINLQPGLRVVVECLAWRLTL